MRVGSYCYDQDGCGKGLWCDRPKSHRSPDGQVYAGTCKPMSFTGALTVLREDKWAHIALFGVAGLLLVFGVGVYATTRLIRKHRAQKSLGASFGRR